jgi:hypothetical protein
MDTQLPPAQHSWNLQAQHAGGTWLSFGRFPTPEEAEQRKREIAKQLARPLRIVRLTTSYHLHHERPQTDGPEDETHP